MIFWAWFSRLRGPLGVRADTFTAIFEYLDGLKRPVCIVETGCVRQVGNFGGDGQSTILFDHYVKFNGGRVYTIDINPEATKTCRKAASRNVEVITGDSVLALHNLHQTNPTLRADLLYLDSFDLDVNDPMPSARHHLNELMAALPLIRAETLVVVDDNFALDRQSEIEGKAVLVAEYATKVGAELKLCGYQVGWVGLR